MDVEEEGRDDALWEQARLLCSLGKKTEAYQIYRALAGHNYFGSHVAAAAILEEQKNPINNEKIYLLLRQGIKTGDDEAALMLGRCVLSDVVNHHSLSKRRAIKLVCAVAACASSETVRGIAHYVLGEFSLRPGNIEFCGIDAESNFKSSARFGCIPALLELAEINLRKGRRLNAFLFACRWAALMGLSEFFPKMRKRLMTT